MKIPISTSGAAGSRRAGERGYALMEALVYIGLVGVVLGTAFMAAYRCIDYSAVLRRNAQDIAKALNVGELWREDVRTASGPVALVQTPEGQVLRIAGAKEPKYYRFENNTVLRQTGSGASVKLITGVKGSQFVQENRKGVLGWRWELELQPRTKGAIRAGRVQPLFTFLAAMGSSTKEVAQ